MTPINQTDHVVLAPPLDLYAPPTCTLYRAGFISDQTLNPKSRTLYRAGFISDQTLYRSMMETRCPQIGRVETKVGSFIIHLYYTFDG